MKIVAQRNYDTDLDSVQQEPLDARSRHLRRLILRAIEKGGRGHIGPSLSLVEIIRVLYDEFVRHDPANPRWPGRDRFILSKGHGCLALYAVLADRGFFPVEALDNFCRFDSFLGGHPETMVPGVEACTGSLGHGLSIGVGMALAARMSDRDSKVYVVMGDGEINEGSVWEAAACADKHRLANLTAIIDYNKIQSAGSVFDIQSMEPLADKWRSFGFRVFECNGHSVDELRRVFQAAAAAASDRPRVVICHTVKGKGIPVAENNPAWHHRTALSDSDLSAIHSALGDSAMRKRSLDMVHTLARRDERVVFIGSDLSPNLLGEMKKEFPQRYYMEGIAEANVVGMAAGMALEGYIPYVNTIATFLTRRCYEQVAVDLCVHDLPVRLIGNGGGYVYAPLGPTHQAIEDIAIMRALPHMTVTAACDAEEMTRLMEASLDWPHPIYIRLGKGGDPIISKPERGFAIGKAIDMIDETMSDSDVLLIATGVATTQALAAAQALAGEGVRCRLLHLHTVKPLDADAIVAAAGQTRLVVTVEEHSVVGGLGSAVLEALSDGMPGALPPVRRLGIPDRFAEHYGSQAALMKDCNLHAEGIANSVRTARLGKRP